MQRTECDILVVGAGPAGLTAAVYLARYGRRAVIVHDGQSRAARISLTHNVPGFPGGVAGPELLSRMDEQARLYGADIRQDYIRSVTHSGGRFEAQGENGVYASRALILATGVCLNEADMPHDLHEEAIRLGCLRYCPICDGFEATGKKVGVIGGDDHGGREALFLRHYTEHVTLMPRIASDLSADQRAELAEAGITVIEEPIVHFEPTTAGMEVRTAGGHQLHFDVVYPALGVTPRSELAYALDVRLTEGGCIPTDNHQQASVPGVFAAGDVVEALDQISVAIGHGAIAATRAHNFLRELDNEVLQAH